MFFKRILPIMQIELFYSLISWAKHFEQWQLTSKSAPKTNISNNERMKCVCLTFGTNSRTICPPTSIACHTISHCESYAVWATCDVYVPVVSQRNHISHWPCPQTSCCRIWLATWWNWSSILHENILSHSNSCFSHYLLWNNNTFVLTLHN